MTGPGLLPYLLVAAAMFGVGLFGMLTRKNLVAVVISVELMANAANLNFVAFARFGKAGAGPLVNQTFALFGMALTVAEVVVGLALLILVSRTHKRLDADGVATLRG